MDKLLVVGGVLLVLMLMLVLRASGLWIAMMLAFCGWVGQAFFIATQPGKNRFSAFWESKASWELAALPFFVCLLWCMALTTVLPASVTWRPDRVMGVERLRLRSRRTADRGPFQRRRASRQTPRYSSQAPA